MGMLAQIMYIQVNLDFLYIDQISVLMVMMLFF